MQVAAALEYMHGKGIMHRDMKPDNLLLCNAKSSHPVVKVCDFGLSEHVGGEGAEERVGTQTWAAPEMLQAGGSPPGTPVDLWGLGMILYMLLGGTHPFEGMDMHSNMLNARFNFNAKTWGKLGDLSKEIIRGLLVVAPEERLTAKQVLAHPWLAPGAAGDHHLVLSLAYLHRAAEVDGVRDAALRVLAKQLPDEQQEQARATFAKLDGDAKGYLEGADLRRALKASGVSEPLRASLVVTSAMLDNGLLSPKERKRALKKERKRRRQSLGTPDLSGAEIALLRRVVKDQLAQKDAADTASCREIAGDEPPKKSKHRGETAEKSERVTERAARGARRLGVVTFDMFLAAWVQQDAILQQHIDATFVAMDADGDGRLGVGDVRVSLERLGVEMTAQRADALLRGACAEVKAAEGGLERAEFARLMLPEAGSQELRAGDPNLDA
jgi:Ca2+-binding EF-hand superfamily protein